MSKEMFSVCCTCRKGILFSKFVELTYIRRILSVGNLYFDWLPVNLSLSDGNGPNLGYVCTRFCYEYSYSQVLLMISLISCYVGQPCENSYGIIMTIQHFEQRKRAGLQVTNTNVTLL